MRLTIELTGTNEKLIRLLPKGSRGRFIQVMLNTLIVNGEIFSIVEKFDYDSLKEVEKLIGKKQIKESVLNNETQESQKGNNKSIKIKQIDDGYSDF